MQLFGEAVPWSFDTVYSWCSNKEVKEGHGLALQQKMRSGHGGVRVAAQGSKRKPHLAFQGNKSPQGTDRPPKFGLRRVMRGGGTANGGV